MEISSRQSVKECLHEARLQSFFTYLTVIGMDLLKSRPSGLDGKKISSETQRSIPTHSCMLCMLHLANSSQAKGLWCLL